MKFLKGRTFQPMPFVVANLDGLILRHGTCPAEMVDLQAQAGEVVFAGVADSATEYLDITNGEVVAKPVIEPIVNELAISNLPNNCVAIVEGQEFAATNGSITLAFDVPGAYRVELRAPRWVDAVVEVIQP